MELNGIPSRTAVAVIPAFNEAKTLPGVLRAVVSHPLLSEVVVVDDGSTDGTANVAARTGVRVIRLEENMGKGSAMEAGVRATEGDVVLFLDADILGMTAEKVSAILAPVLSGASDMNIATFSYPLYPTKRIISMWPSLSGQRAITRTLWDEVPARFKKGFSIEIALNHAARKTGKRISVTKIEGVTPLFKEQKFGWVSGLCRRAVMFSAISRDLLLMRVSDRIERASKLLSDIVRVN